MKQQLHCLVIRGQVGRYPALVQALSKFSDNIKINLIDNDAVTVKKALLDKKLGLVFLFQESGLAVNALADILQKNGSEAILASLDGDKPQSALSVKTGYRGVQVCNLHYKPSGSVANLALKFLIQYAFLKAEFRNCKSLLRVSEQRCHWLVDSSSEAVAYVANDLHLYANHTYIDLLSDSLHSLKITAVSDLILEDEKEVFFDFVRQYENGLAKASALIVTLRPLKGKIFRASIRLIPTVFSGTRCYQLWIRKLGSGNRPIRDEKELLDFSELPMIEIEDIDYQEASSLSNASTAKNSKNNLPKAKESIVIEHSLTGGQMKNALHPQVQDINSNKQAIAMRTNDSKAIAVSSNKPSIYRKLLKQIILNSEISLELEKLDMFNPVDAPIRQYMVDLNVLEREYTNVSSVLDKKYHAVFWDQVMLVLLFQRLKKTGSKNIKLLVPVSSLSMQDEWFRHWLCSSVSHFEGDISGCVFLFSLEENLLIHDASFKQLHQQLMKHQCGMGIDNFGINQHTKKILKIIAPEFVRFSKKWVLSNITSNKQAVKLASSIKILEKNKVKVIAPYKSGRKMRQLFNISGASFCQKQVVS